MRKSLLLAGFVILALSSCSNGSISDLTWMIGTWEGIDENDLTFVEEWQKGGENSMFGKGSTITPDGDTLFKEVLSIELVEGVPYYVAKVPENPAPVLFKLVEADETHCVFENLEHDFPQRIAYTLETKSTMLVKLEGMKDGLPKSESLTFEKNTGVSMLPTDRNFLDSIMNASQDTTPKDSGMMSSPPVDSGVQIINK